jgi:hypothetical protein
LRHGFTLIAILGTLGLCHNALGAQVGTKPLGRNPQRQTPVEAIRDPAGASDAAIDEHIHNGARIQREGSGESIDPIHGLERFHYYIPGAQRGLGDNNSNWITAIRGRNPEAIATSNVRFIVHPEGRESGSNDPQLNPSWNVAPGAAWEWTNALGLVGYTGKGWIEVISSRPIMLDTGITANVSPDGAQQATNFPVFDAQNLGLEQRMAHTGDRVEFRLAPHQSKRLDYVFFVPKPNDRGNLFLDIVPRSTKASGNGYSGSEDPVLTSPVMLGMITPITNSAVRLQMTLRDANNNLVATATRDAKPNTMIQQSVSSLFGGITINPGDALLVEITDPDTGSADVFAYNAIKEIDNQSQTNQDSSTLEGTIHRIVERAEYRTLPEWPETNDQMVYHIDMRTRSGTVISRLDVDLDNNGTIDQTVQGNGTNELRTDITAIAGQNQNPTTPKITINYTNESGAAKQRETRGTEFWIRPEMNNYSATYTSARTYVLANLDLAAAIASHGLYNNSSMKTPSEWRTLWQQLFDGVSSGGNLELLELKFHDYGNELSGNIMDIRCTNGTVIMVTRMPEAEIDTMRKSMNTTLPPPIPLRANM